MAKRLTGAMPAKLDVDQTRRNPSLATQPSFVSQERD